MCRDNDLGVEMMRKAKLGKEKDKPEAPTGSGGPKSTEKGDLDASNGPAAGEAASGSSLTHLPFLFIPRAARPRARGRSEPRQPGGLWSSAWCLEASGRGILPPLGMRGAQAEQRVGNLVSI